MYTYMPKDYYDILGVAKSASQDEIKKAFRKKAHELHPDKGGDEKAFKEVNEAYQALGDEKKRQAYDQFGHQAFQQGGASGFGGFDFSGFGRTGEGSHVNYEDLGDLGDILGGMFGFGSQQRASSKRRGRDVETAIEIDLHEAFRGVTKELSMRMQIHCEQCKGSGVEAGSKMVTCAQCSGQGRVLRAQQTPFGTFQAAATCSACNGRGQKPEKVCTKCKGSGVESSVRKLSVSIPPGINHGETLKMSKQGEALGYGGEAGDLYIHITLKPNAQFSRDGNTVRSQAFIPISLFLTGGSADVETLDGQVALNIPAGTQSGTVFKLRGKGFPYLHGHGKGDHLVTVFPNIPKKVDREQRRIADELKRIGL